MNVANGFTYFLQDFKLQGCKVGNGDSDFAGQGVVRHTVFVQIPGNLIEVAADPAVFGGQLPDSGKQFIIDRGNGNNGAYVVLAVKRKRQAYIKKKIRDKENQAKREEEQSNFGAEENTVWDRLEVQNEELVAAVQQLKPKARFIVTGYVLKGKTFKELAQETKLTERAAASTYYRSIEKLRIKMEKEK